MYTQMKWFFLNLLLDCCMYVHACIVYQSVHTVCMCMHVRMGMGMCHHIASSSLHAGCRNCDMQHVHTCKRTRKSAEIDITVITGVVIHLGARCSPHATNSCKRRIIGRQIHQKKEALDNMRCCIMHVLIIAKINNMNLHAISASRIV